MYLVSKRLFPTANLCALHYLWNVCNKDKCCVVTQDVARDFSVVTQDVADICTTWLV